MEMVEPEKNTEIEKNQEISVGKKNKPGLLLLVVVAILVLIGVCLAVFILRHKALNDSFTSNLIELNTTATTSIQMIPITMLDGKYWNYQKFGDDLYLFANAAWKSRVDTSIQLISRSGKPLLPSYGINTLDGQGYYFTPKGFLFVFFDKDSFQITAETKEDFSCGYLCRYDAYDKVYRYYEGQYYPPAPEGVDANSIKVIYNPDSTYTGFIIADDQVYVRFNTPWYALLSSTFGPYLDASSFRALGGGYYTDGALVIANTFDTFETLEGADADTFYYNTELNLGTDNRYVYHHGTKIGDNGIASFEVVSENLIYKNKDSVFYLVPGLVPRITTLEGADPNTFIYDASADVATDKNSFWTGFGSGNMLKRGQYSLRATKCTDQESLSTCYSLLRMGDNKQNYTVVENLTELFQRFAKSDMRFIEQLFWPFEEETSLLFRVITFSSDYSRIVTFDPDTKEFEYLEQYFDEAVGEKLAPDAKKFTKISSDGKILSLYSVVNNTLTPVETLTGNKSFWGNQCGYAGYVAHMDWIDNETLQYKIYDSTKLMPRDACAFELMETKTKVIN